MKNKQLELLQQQALLVVDNDPELTALRAQFTKYGCGPSESLGATLGRAWAKLSDASKQPATAAKG